MREEKNMQKIDDDTLENVSGGAVIVRNLVYQGDRDNVNGEIAVMSGDTDINPMMLNGRNNGSAGGNVTRNGTLQGGKTGRVLNSNTHVLNTDNTQWA